MDASATELRVLGCLIEKQRTTPDQYPLSLNALRLACNQSTSRDPVMELDEPAIREALERLGRRGWTRLASGAGSRAVKYRHLFDEALGLSRGESSLLAVLMLRGAQTPGELKTRCERLHGFASPADVVEQLEGLAERDLVVRQSRGPGQREDRYAHRLGEGPLAPPAPEPIRSRESKATRGAEIVPGLPLDELPTPALVVDLDLCDLNLERWQREMTAVGVGFRPHVKTHKSPALAQRQLDLGAAGIACAKVSEAEVFVATGIRDVVIAFPILGEEPWRRAAAIAAGGTTLTVNVENAHGARGLSTAATRADTTIGVQLEIDSGLDRVGIRPTELDELEALARLVVGLPGVTLEGLTTYRGAAFASAGETSPAEAGLAEGGLLVELADRLRGRGLAIDAITAGSTPTGRAVAGVSGITEVRAGTYVFNDLMQIDWGSAGRDELALSVLCTVVSRRSGRATIDGGSKTFGGDSRASGGGSHRSLYARATDRDAAVGRLSEEHGVVVDGAETLELGERVAWHPAHACTCVNLADELIGVRAGVVEQVWPIAARGKRT